MRKRHCLVALVCLCLLGFSTIAHAQEQRLYAAGGIEMWVAPYTGGHGYGLLTYQRDNLLQEADLDLTFNTDTLQLSLWNYRLGERLTAGAYLKGQAKFGGLLVDYYSRGSFFPERGFSASYVQFAPHIQYSEAPFFFQLELGVRQWFFGATDTTSPNLVLPPNMFVVEPRVRFTYWDAKFDPATIEPHRHTIRFDGLALGAEMGIDIRSAARQWGAFDTQAFERPDRRNNPSFAPVMIRAFWRGGQKLWKGGRLQAMNTLALGTNEDDITRVRIGGMNPYVVQISGLPWASILATNHVTGHISLHQKVLADSEVGLMIDAISYHEDANNRREAVESFVFDTGHVGLGLFGDWRFGDWQVETKVGWVIPDVDLDAGLHLAWWLSFGRRIF